MSYHTYVQGRKIADKYFDVEALIQAAMRHADTTNATALQKAFPDLWAELQARYNAPGGLIPGDPYYHEATA